jgi:hypothetical protein
VAAAVELLMTHLHLQQTEVSVDLASCLLGTQ